MIPQATAYETDIRVLRDRVNVLRTENETLRDQVRCVEAKLATQIERADYAWRNANVIEKARQKEMANRDELLEALKCAESLFDRKWNGVVGSGCEFHWQPVGNWRHYTCKMTGETFLEAIAKARA